MQQFTTRPNATLDESKAGTVQQPLNSPGFLATHGNRISHPIYCPPCGGNPKQTTNAVSVPIYRVRFRRTAIRSIAPPLNSASVAGSGTAVTLYKLAAVPNLVPEASVAAS